MDTSQPSDFTDWADTTLQLLSACALPIELLNTCSSLTWRCQKQPASSEHARAHAHPTLLYLSSCAGTLAAGINMPARTTVISSLARRTDEGIQLLPHNELLQMAGRAGRRGYDTQGHCVVVQGR